MSIMKYEGYIAQIEYSEEDDEFFGTVVNISRDKICFGGDTVKKLKKHMQEAIDGYIENCRELNMEPEKPYGGRITLRTTPTVHALLVEAAFRAGHRSLNDWMNEVLLHEAEKNLSFSDHSQAEKLVTPFEKGGHHGSPSERAGGF